MSMHIKTTDKENRNVDIFYSIIKNSSYGIRIVLSKGGFFDKTEIINITDDQEIIFDIINYFSKNTITPQEGKSAVARYFTSQKNT